MAPHGCANGEPFRPQAYPQAHPQAASGRFESVKCVANPAIKRYFTDPSSLDSCQQHGEQKEDWRMKPELPTTEEIFGQDDSGSDILLIPNHISGPWPSSEIYLNAHYNLLREDAVGNLRDAVLWVQSNPGMGDNHNISIYEKVFIVQVTLANQGLAFRFQFSTRRAGKKIHWKYSSRLITGGIVALSPVEDSFATKCIVGVVAARPLVHLAKNPPEVDIYFAHPEDIEFDPQQEWTMVQARSGYYEAHRHTMTALQKLSWEQFPLSQHICALETKVGAPEYVSTNPVMDFQALSPATADGNTAFHVLDGLPSTPIAGLNLCQWQALAQVLTKKIAIIQGPPGTGKTHVSVIALKLLLSHMTPDDPPIIIATHTNHALDQILSQIAEFEGNYIRLGGRSGDANIRKRMLYEIAKSESGPIIIGGLLGSARTDLVGLAAQLINVLRLFEQESVHGPIRATTFAEYGLLTQDQCDSLEQSERWRSSLSAENDKNHLAAWLDDQVNVLNLNSWIEQFMFTENDIDMEYEQLKELEAEQGPAGDEWEVLKGRSLQFRTTYQGVEETSYSKEEVQQYLMTSDLMQVPVKARGAVYNLLRDQLLEQVNAKLRTLTKTYIACSNRYKIGRWERDYEILRKSKLIAMTTTGLSKYRGLVSSLNPRIVLIEEAAEVLEAPTAVACFESIQQLILVGDHMQLKAKCTLQDLTGDPFFLDVSMFERLVRNNLPFVKLLEQRRMAPEIRELLMPIYDGLHDHSSMDQMPLVPGMGDVRSFFFTHEWPESGDSLSSKLNELEAMMVVEFYVYLMLNEISTSNMTILTFYNGQRKLILKHMKTNPHLSGHKLKVVTVDSYQGGENEVVLLSLVRSNRHNAIGFLAADNRVCVALSRAKRGFYIFGNSENLEQSSPLWSNIITILENSIGNPRIGNQLPLVCKNHQNETLIKELGDWKTIYGGCKKPCGGELACGHGCPLLCHGFDHAWISCEKLCSHVQQCCGAPCTQVCGGSHPHRCDCAAKISAIEGDSSNDLYAGRIRLNGAYEIDADTKKQIIASEREAFERDIAKKRLLSSTGAELLIDTEAKDTDSERAERVASWGEFANNGRIGTIATIMDTFPSVSSGDVQEGLEKANERFISLTSKKLSSENATVSTSNAIVKSSYTKTPPPVETPVPPLIDLIEFD